MPRPAIHHPSPDIDFILFPYEELGCIIYDDPLAGLKAEELKPQTMISGDANVTGGGGGFDPQWSRFLGASIDAAWDKTLHVRAGNLAMTDGSVQATKTAALRSAINQALASGLTNVVFSKPRGVL
jgi:hypothetical protein